MYIYIILSSCVSTIHMVGKIFNNYDNRLINGLTEANNKSLSTNTHPQTPMGDINMNSVVQYYTTSVLSLFKHCMVTKRQTDADKTQY